MQADQFLRGDAMAVVGVEHLMEIVQPLRIHTQQMRHDAHPLTQQQFALIQCVCLGGEGRVSGCVAIRLADRLPE